MLFMAIERFKDRNAVAVYRRVRDEGRLLPEGVRFIDSWIEANLHRCFQLVECEDPRLLQEWVVRWQGQVEFEFVAIVPSADTQKVVASYLDLT